MGLREPLDDVAFCGLPAALEAIGERWSFLILRGAFNGQDCSFNAWAEVAAVWALAHGQTARPPAATRSWRLPGIKGAICMERRLSDQETSRHCVKRPV
jgi:hypothetical protein